MKIRIISVAFASLLLLGIMPAFGEPKGDAGTVKGEVVDLWCYLEGGDHGAEHRKCAVTCAKVGNPIGLLTEQGDVYVLVGIKDHDPDRDARIGQMAETVAVEGTLVKKGGTQVIYVSAVK